MRLDDLNDARREQAEALAEELVADERTEDGPICRAHGGTYAGQEALGPGSRWYAPKREPICDLVASGQAAEGECEFPGGIDP
jgi:hypothetical protein